MINSELKEVNIGQAIKEHLEKLGMTKSEFGRQIGVPQQHVNRIFERDTIESKRLYKICRALDYNFFELFCHFPSNVNAYFLNIPKYAHCTEFSAGHISVSIQTSRPFSDAHSLSTFVASAPF